MAREVAVDTIDENESRYPSTWITDGIGLLAQ